VLSSKSLGAAVPTTPKKAKKALEKKKATKKDDEDSDKTDREGMKELYTELLGLDELLRDKLFIVQVRSQNCKLPQN